MDIDRFTSFASRVFFGTAFALFAVAVIAWVLRGFGLWQDTYTPGRLMEFAVICLVFVIALLLRQVREELRKPRA